MVQTSNINPRYREALLLLSYILLFIGFNTSRALISIGVAGLVAQGILFYPLRETCRNFIRRPELYVISLLFFIVLFSGANSEDRERWLNWLRISLPFLALPFAFAAKPIKDKVFRQVLLAFVGVMTISAAVVLGNYFLHATDINERLWKGGVVPVPFSHIRYNLLLVFACCAALFLSEKNDKRPVRIILLLAAVSLFIAVHVLAARSAWLAIYCCAFCRLLFFIFQKKNIGLAIGMFAALLLFPACIYFSSETVRIKILHTRYEMGEMREHKIEGHSDAMRLASWHTGLHLIANNFWFGTGAGDIEEASNVASLQLFPGLSEESRKMPHNEFIWIFAATGVFGFLAFCISFFYPFISFFKRRSWLFVCLFLIFLTSFLSEYPLQEQVGGSFYLSFLLLFLNRRDV